MSDQDTPERTPDDDLFALATVGLLYLGVVLAIVASLWAELMAWLAAHAVLVPARQDPPIVLPNSAGAGLDFPRVIIALSAAVALITAAANQVRRRRSDGDSADG